MDDHYATLEVSKTATAEEIKSSFRRLAKKWHPDRNPNNRKEAGKRFRKISAAYDVLSDANKRQTYDRLRDLSGGSGRHGIGSMSLSESEIAKLMELLQNLGGSGQRVHVRMEGLREGLHHTLEELMRDLATAARGHEDRTAASSREHEDRTATSRNPTPPKTAPESSSRDSTRETCNGYETRNQEPSRTSSRKGGDETQTTETSRTSSSKGGDETHTKDIYYRASSEPIPLGWTSTDGRSTNITTSASPTGGGVVVSVVTGLGEAFQRALQTAATGAAGVGTGADGQEETARRVNAWLENLAAAAEAKRRMAQTGAANEADEAAEPKLVRDVGEEIDRERQSEETDGMRNGATPTALPSTESGQTPTASLPSTGNGEAPDAVPSTENGAPSDPLPSTGNKPTPPAPSKTDGAVDDRRRGLVARHYLLTAALLCALTAALKRRPPPDHLRELGADIGRALARAAADQAGIGAPSQQRSRWLDSSTNVVYYVLVVDRPAIQDKAKTGMGSGGGSVGCVFWGLIWLLVLFFVSFFVAGFCAGWYILFLPLTVCVGGLTGLTDTLLTGVQFPKTCAENMMNGKPLC